MRANLGTAPSSGPAWLSLDGAALYRAMVTISEHYNSHLEAELTARLGTEFEEVTAQADRRPVREMVGVPAVLSEAWSSRRVQIEAETDRLARQFGEDHGRAPTAREMIQLAQQANLATRQAKHEPRSLADQRRTWRAQAVAVLGSDEAVDAITTDTCHEPEQLSAGEGLPDDRVLDRVAELVTETVSRSRAR
ncbi:MAG TPA: relaxase domain-containing protein, partial [Microlunatus sp.]|nr:relaxase domain-containing protein [Microlunatus sp.]